MKILVLSRFAPGDGSGGAALRISQNLHALGRMGEVDVLTVGLPETSRPVPGIRHWEARGVRSLSARRRFRETLRNRLWPLRPGAHPELDMYHHLEVEAWLRRRCREERYDAIVMEELVFGRYLDTLRAAGAAVVYDAHNVEGVLHETIGADSHWAAGGRVSAALKRWLLRGRMKREERRVVRGVDAVWCCSALDAEGMRSHYGPLSVPLEVVPNAIDVRRYRELPPPDGAAWTRDEMTLLFVGSYAYPPNEAAALRLIQGVLPALRAMGRRARVRLVGRGVTGRMREAAATDDAVDLVGSVDSVLPVLAEPCVVVLPITAGGGTRLKVLEAFAAGRPVVSTGKGAEGIDATDGRELLLAEDDRTLAEAACRVWDDAGLRVDLCRRARELVEARYSWEAVAAIIEHALSRVAGQRNRRG
ncbi:MAG: glycosyltransferase [Verrucomicrobia bacterium]|nr:MAG: glycosyltransferase [Verrucomicrobiota bacterium]